MRINKKIILLAIYKHSVMSVEQLAFLFNKTSKRSIQNIIANLLKQNKITKNKNSKGIHYFLTSSGAKDINLGLQRVNRIRAINDEHTWGVLKTINYLIDQNKIQFDNFEELLKVYETDRELKRRKFSELGGKALKYRWVDLLVKIQDRYLAYEIEITRKQRRRYKNIVLRLDHQFKKEKWLQTTWVVKKMDKLWLSNVIKEARPESKMTIVALEEI